MCKGGEGRGGEGRGGEGRRKGKGREGTNVLGDLRNKTPHFPVKNKFTMELTCNFPQVDRKAELEGT